METDAPGEPERTGCGYGASQWAAATEEGSLGRRASRRGLGSEGAGHDDERRCRLIGRGAGEQHGGVLIQQSTRGGARLHH